MLKKSVAEPIPVGLCQCGCGQKTTVPDRNDIRKGWTKGHPIRFKPGHNHLTHGMTGTPEHKTYLAAKTRCTNEKTIGYEAYGGRGIEFRFGSFEEFLRCLGPKPGPEYSIERIKVNGHYEPGNVKWIPKKDQARNQRQTRLSVAIAKQIRNLRKRGWLLSELATKYGVPVTTISNVTNNYRWKL